MITEPWRQRLQTLPQVKDLRATEILSGERINLALTSFVDDFICTGKGDKFERCLKKTKEAVKWGSWKVNTFTHCGRNISRDADVSVLVEQHVYVDKLRPVVLESNRVGIPLRQKEVDQTRTL